MQFDKLIAVVPLAKPDPDPADLTEGVAEATLGGFQALWHPLLLSRSSTLPIWVSAAEPPVPAPGQLIVVPEGSRRFIPAEWWNRAEPAGAKVISGESTRDAMLVRVLQILPHDATQADGQLAAESFLALGVAHLWLQMLTAYMKHPSTLNEEHFQKEVLAAAAAAVIGDAAGRDDHLRAAFQLLSEARQSLYPVELNLLDLCLVDPRAGMDRLDRQLNWGQPINVFLSGRTADQLRHQFPTLAEQLRVALDESRAELVGGEFDEVASTLLPLESHLRQFERGETSYRAAFGRTPLVFGRRRFGLAPYVLQLLNRLEIHQATHFCFDDGVYPAARDAKVRCEAPDSSTVEALARVPIAADRAVEWLSFPSHLARTIMSDHVATLPLVHWPMPDCPWYSDLLRITQYANVFGRFSTLSNYFQTTDPSPMSTRAAADEYTSPYLDAAHSCGAAHPISEFAEHHRLRTRFEGVRWLQAMVSLLGGAVTGAVDASASAPNRAGVDLTALEEAVESRDAGVAGQLATAEDCLGSLLAALVCPRGSAGEAGVLVFNPLAFDRRVALAPHRNGPNDEAQPSVSVELPAMGFAWLAACTQPPAAAPGQSAAAVDGQIMHNEHIEVEIDANSGGIRRTSDRATGTLLLGQQLVLQGIPAVRDRTPAAGNLEPSKSQMRATSMHVRSSGPDLAEVVLDGELLAVPCPAWASDSCMARFRQRYRLGRGERMLRVTVEILDLAAGAIDPHASPWNCYLAARFAWPDPAATLMRAVGPTPELSRTPRPETSQFVELHDRRHRTAILTGGLPFHQRVGERMLDVLLVSAGETARTFEFAVGVDLPNPFQAALDLITPPVMIPWDSDPPVSGPTGWFFHLDAPNIVITSLAALGPDRLGVRVRMFESAGRYTRAQFRCVRDVVRAEMTDFRGQRLLTLEAQADIVFIDLAPREIAQVEIEFR